MQLPQQTPLSLVFSCQFTSIENFMGFQIYWQITKKRPDKEKQIQIILDFRGKPRLFAFWFYLCK
jgi:hypothetical protein